MESQRVRQDWETLTFTFTCNPSCLSILCSFFQSKDFLFHHLLFFSPSPSSFSSFFLSSSSFLSTLENLSLLFLQIRLPLHFFFLPGTSIIWMLALQLYFSICLGFSFHIFCLSFPSSLREDDLSLAFHIINVSPPHRSCLLSCSIIYFNSHIFHASISAWSLSSYFYPKMLDIANIFPYHF